MFLRQVNIGTAAPKFSWPTELSRICINVYQWIYLCCFFYLEVVSVLRAADYSSTGPGVGWSSVGRPRNLVIVVSQVTATVDWYSLFPSSFRAEFQSECSLWINLTSHCSSGSICQAVQYIWTLLSIFLPEPWKQSYSQLSLEEWKSRDEESSVVVGWDAFWACGQCQWLTGLYKPATLAGGEHNLWMSIWIHLWANYIAWVQSQPFPAKFWGKKRDNNAWFHGQVPQ